MVTTFRENLYEYLAQYLAQYETSPTFAEMIEAMGISPRSKSLITRNLRALEKEGKVKLSRVGRRLFISLSAKHLVIMGKISAGNPIEALPQNHFLEINDLLGGENKFALQVKGSSMIEEGIHDGDIIICRQTSTAKEGDIVVALIDQCNATLKRISYKIKGMITLLPENINLKPRSYHPERIHVQGIYIGLIRMNS
jgi:repressor LexA